MLAAADMSSGVGARSHVPAPPETLGGPRMILRHAGARAVPGSCEEERRAFKALPMTDHSVYLVGYSASNFAGAAGDEERLVSASRSLCTILGELPKPTVSLDVISLVASSYGYYKGQIEQRAAQ